MKVFTEDKTSRMTGGLFSSRTEEWATPQYVFDYLSIIFPFNTDVASTEENAKCKHHFTKVEDGLKQEWRGVCFMNPPYGKEIYKWMQKAYEAGKKGATVVCLVPARTDTRWFHEYAMKADEIWLIKGRLKFGDSFHSAPFPSCIVIFKGGDLSEPKIKSTII